MSGNVQVPQQFQIPLYEATTRHWAHAEQIRWTLLSNFLVAASILLISWAAVFTSANAARLVLISLSCAGTVLSLVWLFLVGRANGFVKMYDKLGRDAEGLLPAGIPRPFESAHQYRTVTSWWATRWVRTSIVVIVVPVVFVILFVVLLIVSR